MEGQDIPEALTEVTREQFFMKMVKMASTVKGHSSCVLCEDEGRNQGVQYEGMRELSMHIFTSLINPKWISGTTKYGQHTEYSQVYRAVQVVQAKTEDSVYNCQYENCKMLWKNVPSKSALKHHKAKHSHSAKKFMDENEVFFFMENIFQTRYNGAGFTRSAFNELKQKRIERLPKKNVNKGKNAATSS